MNHQDQGMFFDRRPRKIVDKETETKSNHQENFKYVWSAKYFK